MSRGYVWNSAERNNSSKSTRKLPFWLNFKRNSSVLRTVSKHFRLKQIGKRKRLLSYGFITGRRSNESDCNENRIENFPVEVGHRACHELFSSFCLRQKFHQNFFFAIEKFSVDLAIVPWNPVRLHSFSLRLRNFEEFPGLFSLEMFPFCQPGSILNPKLIFIKFFSQFKIMIFFFRDFFFKFFSEEFFRYFLFEQNFLFEFLFSFVSKWI